MAADRVVYFADAPAASTIEEIARKFVDGLGTVERTANGFPITWLIRLVPDSSGDARFIQIHFRTPRTPASAVRTSVNVRTDGQDGVTEAIADGLHRAYQQVAGAVDR